jgi:hypothetical protein
VNTRPLTTAPKSGGNPGPASPNPGLFRYPHSPKLPHDHMAGSGTIHAPFATGAPSPLTTTLCFGTGFKWWARLGSNQRPLRCQRSALPLSYAPTIDWPEKPPFRSFSPTGVGLARRCRATDAARMPSRPCMHHARSRAAAMRLAPADTFAYVAGTRMSCQIQGAALTTCLTGAARSCEEYDVGAQRDGRTASDGRR